MTELEQLNKKIIRIVYESPKSANTLPLMLKSNCTTVKDLHRQKILNTLYKAKKDCGPKITKDFFEWNPEGARRENFLKNRKAERPLESSPPAIFPQVWNKFMRQNQEFSDSLMRTTRSSFNRQTKRLLMTTYDNPCTNKKCYSCLSRKRNSTPMTNQR